ncbi:MAG: translation elongation factor 4 [Candidatus Eisenbacteria bacterium]
MDLSHIRNFCIIAHIDHGKSTLADRFLEVCGTLSKKEMKDQVLDNMDLERERGITIKAHAIAMDYHSLAGQDFRFHLIDTPGHVDFSYEVSRSLAACEGALLLVDATQGIEAQTVSNLHMALEAGLEIIPVVNKIDMPAARPEDVAQQIKNLIGSRDDEILYASAKEGVGVREILEAVVARVPAPSGNPEAPLRALIFDSSFDQFRGVVAYIRVVDGVVRRRDSIRLLSNNIPYEVDEVGNLRLSMVPRDDLHAGEVGYLLCGMKNVADAKVGDTVAPSGSAAVHALPGFKPMKPMVYSGLFPIDTEDYLNLKEALAKLCLNDSALSYVPETSAALGFGFRCGFLGPLHLEIVQERMSREFNLDIIATIPNVSMKVTMADGDERMVDSPAEMPEPGHFEKAEEPFIEARIITPTDYTGSLMQLVQERRGEFTGLQYLDPTRVQLTYKMPLSEIIYDFYDKLKSISRGYATLDYEWIGFMESDLVKLTVLLNGDQVDALSIIVHRDKAYDRGRELVDKLRELIPRQMFQIAIQAAIGGKIVARSTVSALRKDVLAKCYGGDITRKRKLLEKQKEGKKKMKQIGSVHVPQEAFLALLKSTE